MVTRLNPSTLKVNEIFGPTLQGEGPFTGQLAVWVRLAFCNLRCEWCDTAYSWAYTEPLAARHVDGILYDRQAEVHDMTVMAIRQEVIERCKNCIVVFSGGEPLLQTGGKTVNKLSEPKARDRDDLLGELAHTLHNAGYRVHIETAGTKLPGFLLHGHVEHYVVSPKLASSGNAAFARRVPEVLSFYAALPNVTFKFVITDRLDKDLLEVDELVGLYDIRPDTVMLMPEGRDIIDVLAGTKRLAQPAVDRGYGLSTRLHTLIWGNKRGH